MRWGRPWGLPWGADVVVTITTPSETVEDPEQTIEFEVDLDGTLAGLNRRINGLPREVLDLNATSTTVELEPGTTNTIAIEATDTDGNVGVSAVRIDVLPALPSGGITAGGLTGLLPQSMRRR